MNMVSEPNRPVILSSTIYPLIFSQSATNASILPLMGGVFRARNCSCNCSMTWSSDRLYLVARIFTISLTDEAILLGGCMLVRSSLVHCHYSESLGDLLHLFFLHLIG